MLHLQCEKCSIRRGFFQGMKNLFKLFLAYCLTAVLITQTAIAKDIKFVQITDSHFSTSKADYTEREVEISKSVLEKTVKDINSISNIDFVVFTGDNIDQADDTQLKKFLKIANKLKYPYYVVIGNHEVFKSQNLTKKDYMRIVRRYSKNCRPWSANYVFEKSGIVFIVVDGAKEIIPGPAGYFRKDTLNWLDKKLSHYKYSKVVIFQHFPVVEPYYNRTHMTYNKEAYEEVLKKHNNVVAIVSGHFHANGEKMVDGVYHVSTPALIAPPHDYKIIELVGNNREGYQVYTQLRHAE